MGGAYQIDARHCRADQPDQAEPEAVPVGDGVALDQPAGGERRGEPGGGGPVDTEPAPEVGHPELALLGDQFERPHRAGDRWTPPTWSSLMAQLYLALRNRGWLG